jgi:hypothetical protein
MHGRSDRGHPNLTMDPVEDSEPPTCIAQVQNSMGKAHTWLRRHLFVGAFLQSAK